MKEYITKETQSVLAAFDDVPADFQIELETPQHADHGDLSSNAAMKLARYLKRSPRSIAEDLAELLKEKPVDPRRISGIEVANLCRELYPEVPVLLVSGYIPDQVELDVRPRAR